MDSQEAFNKLSDKENRNNLINITSIYNTPEKEEVFLRDISNSLKNNTGIEHKKIILPKPNLSGCRNKKQKATCKIDEESRSWNEIQQEEEAKLLTQENMNLKEMNEKLETKLKEMKVTIESMQATITQLQINLARRYLHKQRY